MFAFFLSKKVYIDDFQLETSWCLNDGCKSGLQSLPKAEKDMQFWALEILVPIVGNEDPLQS